jgi:hypothetical protein
MGVRPTDNSGCLLGGHPDVIVLSSKRRFEPQYIDLGGVGSIGSGNNVELYSGELQALQSNPSPNMQAEIGCQGGMGRLWASTLARLLRANPSHGISQFVHHILVWRDRVQIKPLDLTRFAADSTTTEYKMPTVANGWTAFQEFAKNLGLSAAEARS